MEKIMIAFDDPVLKKGLVALAEREQRSLNRQIIKMLRDAIEIEALSPTEEAAIKRIKNFLVKGNKTRGGSKNN
jgi:hypothetical protein